MRRLLGPLVVLTVVACSSGASDTPAEPTAAVASDVATAPTLEAPTAVAAGTGAPAPLPITTATPVATGTPAPALPTATPDPAWVVGTTLLPLRPDGFGEVLPTPEVLQDRRLPTVDVLPPPADGAFAATTGAVDATIAGRIGGAWQDGCPVALEDLRYLTLVFWGFDDRAHTGEMIVHADVAEDVAHVFEQLFAARFPLEGMRLATGADLDAPPTGDGNITGAFICRPARQSGAWSAHASGLAIDVNPFQNPYVRDDLVLPELASAYLDRGWVRPGMILPGDVVTQAFANIGWTWGATWTSLTDSMHFSATGR